MSGRYLRIEETMTQDITGKINQNDRIPAHRIRKLTRKIDQASVQFIDCGRGTGS